MSVRGLYDSETGDRLARKLLGTYRDPELRERPERKRKMCACGRELTRPYIQRDGVNVCKVCAENIPRNRGGHNPTHKCACCGKSMSRVYLVLRKGKLYCDRCKKAF